MLGADIRQLNFFGLTALLITAHYGLGFLLGTGEKALTLGFAGSLYAICIGLGTLALLLLARFYWRKIDQIWTLMGNRYGDRVKVLIGVMAWSSLIGIEAVQLISGAFILKVLGLPVVSSMISLTVIFVITSLLPVERASKLFQALLLLNILALLYSLWQLQGLDIYGRSLLGFGAALPQIEPSHILGIAVSTILLVMIDMKYQQFIVRARNVQNLYVGCALAGGVLLLLALLPSSVVIAAQRAAILPSDLDGKAVIPFILSWIGGGNQNWLGISLILVLVVPALGVGSSVLRMQTKTVLDFNWVPANGWTRWGVSVGNAVIALAVALRGGTIVNLIVCFYAAYVAAAWVPFLAYLLEQGERYVFFPFSVQTSLLLSSAAALGTLGISLAWPEMTVLGTPELDIMAVGLMTGLLSLVGAEAYARSPLVSQAADDA